MKTILTPIFVLTFILTTNLFIAADTNNKDKDEFVPIFNGKDLTDWSGIPDGWKVENGCIVGESTPEKPCKKSHYLYWTKKEPDNFHLKLTFRMQGKGSNSGIQFRSEKRPNWDTYGYQADVDDSLQWTGCLFHHKRAAVVKRGFDNKVDPDGKVQSKQFADPNELIKLYKPNDWNDYEIIADGSVITLLINGKMMCRVDDQHAKDSAKTGIIALQMHQGQPMKVEFKNIQLKELKTKTK
ncbi:MAG: DUF1080 domain-containing protein [Planctomycetaceae bacterium]|jgi:hypothetical protein|nr:DUF1080 domain-containing protein [Planctomycetaceae bacterium]